MEQHDLQRLFKRKIVVSRLTGGILLFALVFLAVALWSITRNQSPHLRVQHPGELMQLLPSIVSLSQGDIDPGNRVVVLQNGAFFDSLLADIAAAKQTVHFESYVWWKGEICNRLASAFAAKARQGVEVRVLLDASGSSKMDENLEKLMRESGVRLERFHPPRISNLGRMNNRDHRKIAVIDGRIGYVGGHGVAEEWTGNAQDKDHWRDTFVRVEGPVVNKLQGAFCENWIEESGEVPAGEKYFPKLQPVGTTPAHVAFSSPLGSVSSVQLLYYLAIKAARKQLIIQNPYFLPDPDAMDALIDAKRRGVDVEIMLPATSVNDSPIVQHASHHHYGTLLKHGIRIFEFNKTLLHQKLIIVDGVWSCVGSTNFDDRSFKLNDEISMGIIDPAVAQQLLAAYASDMRYAKEMKFDAWQNRGWWHKLKDALAYSINAEL